MIPAATSAAFLAESAQASASQTAVAQARALDLRKPQKMSEEQIDAVAKDFESMFLSQMLTQMFGESVGDSLFGDKQTQDIYKGLMVEEYGKHISRAGGIGLADHVKKELLAIQEVPK